MEWTQDARGGGNQASLSVEGATVTIQPVEHVHFISKAINEGPGKYTFGFSGTNFKFAWSISPNNSANGTTLILQKAPGEKMALIHVNWSGFYYGWHNALDQFRNQIDFSFDATAWNQVEIVDNGTTITVTFNGTPLDFFSGPGQTAVGQFLKEGQNGFVGIANNDRSQIKFQRIMFAPL